MTRSTDYDDRTDEALNRQRLQLGFGLAGAVIVLVIAYFAFFG